MTAISEKTRPYWNPYVAGVLLGLVLLATFVIMGHGIGVSGAVSSVVATGVNAIAPEHARANPYLDAYLGNGDPLRNWLVFEVIGVLIGGMASAIAAGRLKVAIDRGPRINASQRLVFALVGGAIMGFGTRLARGCTSGQALTGGALLAVGSWAFMLAIFAGGYAASALFRRQWT